MNKFLITGGAGYIGSHFLEGFLNSELAHDSRVWVVDDLSAGHQEFIDALRILAREKGVAEFHFDRKSLLDESFVRKHVAEVNPDVVLHFAGRISVAESMREPDLYFASNVRTTKNLLQALSSSTCRRFVFSSTAAVYQQTDKPEPLQEDSPLGPVNPYGENKLQVENMLDAAAKSWGLQSVIFRYFNAAGASLSGRFGEWHEPETHLIPLLLSHGNRASENTPFKVYGSDYPTADGTCVRDYIHVTDLANAHLQAIRYLSGPSAVRGAEIFNLGTSQGVSVLEMLRAASQVVGQEIPHEMAPRREGDAAVLIASFQKAQEALGWKPEHSSIEQILKTAQAWERTLQKIRSV